MRFYQKYQQFKQLSFEEKKLFIEAYIVLGKMRMALLTLSFKSLTRSLIHSPYQKETLLLTPSQEKIAQEVGETIVRASRYTPWQSACLVQSLTAQKMLEKRGISGMFHLGVSKNKETPQQMKAHAWTQCGKSIITGKEGHKAFTVVSVFSWKSEE